MLALKLLTQIAAAVSAIGIAVLDYLWHDKRTRKFKTLRRAVFLLLMAAPIAGLIVTVIDQRDHTIESKESAKRTSALQLKIDSLRGQLTAATQRLQESAAHESSQLDQISAKANQLDAELAPFLALAKARYPGLSEASALIRLRDDIHDLQTRAAALETAAQQRDTQERQLARLKDTAPSVRAELALSNREFFVAIAVDNGVPIQADWVVVTSKNIILSGLMLREEELHPTAQLHVWKVKTGLDTTRVVDQFVELRLRFHSIYWDEMGKPDRLKGEIIKSYTFNGESLARRSPTGNG